VIAEAVTSTTVVEVIGLGSYGTHAAELVFVTKLVDCDKLTVTVWVVGWTKLEHAELITLQTNTSNWGGSFEIGHELDDVDTCDDVVVVVEVVFMVGVVDELLEGDVVDDVFEVDLFFNC
jgi:hypothetical protein